MHWTRRTPTDRLRGKAGWALALLVLVGVEGRRRPYQRERGDLSIDPSLGPGRPPGDGGSRQSKVQA
jgi:MYXO-CTERM domain-containing protein